MTLQLEHSYGQQLAKKLYSDSLANFL